MTTKKVGNQEAISINVFKNFFNKTDAATHSEIATVNPKTLGDAQTIVDYLNENISVVVNFEKTDENEIKHILDFINGKIYGVAGTKEQISEKIFVFTPNNITVEAVDKKKKFW